MKTKLSILILAGSLSIVACNDKKQAYDSDLHTTDSITTADHDEHGHDHNHDHADADAVVDIEAPVNVTISGTVGEITNGKDGYTAQLKDDSGKEYYVTISRANLDDPKQYRELKAGDKITVKGESFKLDNKLHIKVEELK